MSEKKELSVLEKSLLENINKKFGKTNPIVRLSDSEYGAPRGWIDTGILALNWLISGKFDGGYPVGRITELDGDPGTGKSLLCQMAIADPTIGLTVYFDTEAALNQEFLQFLGIDPSKILYEPIDTVEQLIDICQEVLDTIVMNKQTEKKVLMLIDSVALASTEKEMDPEAGCYVGNTIVTVLDEKNKEAIYKKIQDIKVGDRVLTHLSNYKEVEKVFTFTKEEKPELIEIELENNKFIRLTPSHKLLVERNNKLQWIAAEELTESDILKKIR